MKLFNAVSRFLLIIPLLAMLFACETPTIPDYDPLGCDGSIDSPTPTPTPADNHAFIYPNPTVELPPDAGSPIVMGTMYSLKNYGYEQVEYFYGGTANSYVNTSELKRDGKWDVAAADSAEYKSRMLIYRPIDMSRFNGTVVMEWLNVTGAVDTSAEWTILHTELIRSGYIYVAISAQSIGIEGGEPPLPNPMGMAMPLKNLAPRRYKSLSHPGDSFSYDIFAQAAQAIRHPQGISPLGDVQFERLIAMGESQSAGRLVTFINAFGKKTDLFDGYFIHSRLGYKDGFKGASGPLSELPQTDVPTAAEVIIREDIDKPVMDVQTEADLFVLGSYPNRQDDNDMFRLWEITGAAHADYYSMNSGMYATGDETQADIIISKRPVPVVLKCDDPVSSAPQHHFVCKAALAALNTWIKDGTKPPTADRIEVVDGAIVRDEFGNALGGIRSPYVDVPVATFSGENGLQDMGKESENICFLFGTTAMLDDATLQSLYPNHQTYVDAVSAHAYKAVEDGFLLAADAEIIVNAAEAGDIPPVQ